MTDPSSPATSPAGPRGEGCCLSLLIVMQHTSNTCSVYRRKLIQDTALPVGMTANGFASADTASQAVVGLTNAVNDGTLNTQMQSLSGLTISSLTAS